MLRPLLLVLTAILVLVPLRSMFLGNLFGDLLSKEHFAKKYGPWGLVIGASRGLGSAWAHGLAQRGLNVIITGRTAKTLNETLLELQAAYPKQQFIMSLYDAGDMNAVEKTSTKYAKEYQVGMVVYNAVFTPFPGQFLSAPPEDVAKTINVNLFGLVTTVQIFGNAMRQRGRGGGFVLVSSVAGSLGINHMSMYSSTKAWLTMLGETLWTEGKKDNIDYVTPIVGQTTTPSLDDFLNPEARITILETSPQNVVRETMWALGRQPYIHTGWSTKVQGFLYWLFPHEIIQPMLATASSDLFKKDDATVQKFQEVKTGRQSRN